MTPNLAFVVVRAVRFAAGVLADRLRAWLARRSLLQLAALAVAAIWLLGFLCRQVGDAGKARALSGFAVSLVPLLALFWIMRVIVRDQR